VNLNFLVGKLNSNLNQRVAAGGIPTQSALT